MLFPNAFARMVPSSAALDLVTFEFLPRGGRGDLPGSIRGRSIAAGTVTPGRTGSRDMQLLDWYDKYLGPVK